MTPDEMIEVIQAYKDGKHVQSHPVTDGHCDWSECRIPSWNFLLYNYRVKPEPREFYIPVWNGLYSSNFETAYHDEETLLRTCDPEELAGIIKAREVIGE